MLFQSIYQNTMINERQATEYYPWLGMKKRDSKHLVLNSAETKNA